MAQQTIDTMKVQQVSEVVVKAVRASKNAPFAVANIKKSELQNFSRTGKELPFLFARTPGVLAWSDNGTGVGNAYIRMRGAAASRINVTLDGVALNSPEDQSVFWANMNSYSALMGSAQIQRGVGTSTNGDGAFGGSISLATAAPSVMPSFELTTSYGSYGTYNAGANFSTGLLWNHLIFDGAYHESATQGFVHGTDGRSGSYYGGLTWLGNNFQIRYKNIGNFEKTGQAWNGVLTSDYNTNDVFPNINSYKDLWNAGLGRVNTLVEDVVYDADAWAEGNYTVKPYMTRDGKKWDKTTDNFYQNHNILSFAWTPSEHWSHNMALHYTYGRGYYKEFKKSTSLAKKFGLPEDKDLKDDAIRKKGLTQNCYGMVYNVNFKNDNWDVIGGVNLQQFSCNHWGYVTYIGSQALEQKYLSNGKYKYYDSDADKYDYSGFLKATYSFLDHWNVFADLQYRYVKYKTDGLNDRFVKKDGKYVNQELNINDDFNFFNPKAGVSYTNGGHKAYASVAMANREPERNNYTDNYNYPYPKNEKVIDVEAGYQYVGSNWNVGANFYYMDYDNQLVQTGEQSDIGEALTTNVKKSYRMGVELNAGWAPLSWLSVEGNAALSKNKIKDFDEFVESWDASENYVHQNHYSNSTLAYSPSAILNGFIDFHHKGFTATWHTNFVSKQYIDNSESDVRSLPCYSQSDLQLRYTSDVTKAAGIKNVTLGLDFNNVFSRHYAASGSTWYGWYTGGQRYQALAYVPMAGFNVMGHLTLKF
ncbi:MAG: TonB-dependent receptor [Prevotellaceae bacterium]|nr:TonB-dependent receptor [Prevotellaceae bacterium]